MASSDDGPKWRRRVGALLLLGATLLLAACVYLVGFFSDWSGQHSVPTVTIVGAAVVLGVGSLTSIWVLLSHR